ncbi:MAG: hypothetical protein ACE5EC_07215, partial [Phycisphaerae bacterium]
AMLSAVVNIRSVSNDNIPNVIIPASLLSEGNLELSEFDHAANDPPTLKRYWLVQTDGGVYARYPIWTGVVATPIFAPFILFGDGLPSEALLLRIGRLAALVFCGLFGGVLAVTLRRFMSGSRAVLLTILTLHGTTLWHCLGSQLTNQTLPILCLALILFLLTGTDMTRRRALASGLLAGLAVAARLPVLFMAAAPLGLFLSRPKWRRYIPIVAAAALVFPLLTLFYNQSVFGGFFTTGYSAETNDRFDAPFWEGLAGLIFSPTCGLLIYSPFLLLAVIKPAPIRAVTERERSSPKHDDLARWLLLGILGQWLLFAKWWSWNGGLIYGGSRMLVETIPALVLLIGIHGSQSTDAILIRSSAAGLNPLSRRKLSRLLPALGVFSVALFLVGTVAYDAIAPTNPTKPTWDITRDFIALYLREFGLVSLITETLKQGALLLGTFLAGGYLVSRFLDPADASTEPKTQPGCHA